MSGQQNYTEDPAVMGFNNQQPVEEEEEEEELTVLDSQHVCNLFIIFIQRKLSLSHGLISCNRPLCLRLLSSSAAAAMWLMLMIFDVSAAAGQEASGSSDRPAAKQTAENQPGAEWKGLLHSIIVTRCSRLRKHLNELVNGLCCFSICPHVEVL